MAPHRDTEATARGQHAVDLGNGVGRRAPDTAEARDDVERAVRPGQRVHVADADVGLRVPVEGDGDEPRRRVDSRACRAPRSGEFDREPRPTGDVEDPIAGAHRHVLVQAHVLAGVPRLAQRGEIDRSATPPLVNETPLGRDIDLGFDGGVFIAPI